MISFLSHYMKSLDLLQFIKVKWNDLKVETSIFEGRLVVSITFFILYHFGIAVTRIESDFLNLFAPVGS